MIGSTIISIGKANHFDFKPLSGTHRYCPPLVSTNKQNHCIAVVFRSIKSVFFINSFTYHAAFPACSSFHPFPSAYAHTKRFFLCEAG